jgi:hypothetical protein
MLTGLLPATTDRRFVSPLTLSADRGALEIKESSSTLTNGFGYPAGKGLPRSDVFGADPPERLLEGGLAFHRLLADPPERLLEGGLAFHRLADPPERLLKLVRDALKLDGVIRESLKGFSVLLCEPKDGLLNGEEANIVRIVCLDSSACVARLADHYTNRIRSKPSVTRRTDDIASLRAGCGSRSRTPLACRYRPS